MKTNRIFTSLRYLSSFAIGVTVGAGVALMFAPMPGRKMQKKVGNIADKVMDKVDDFAVAARRLAV